MKELESLEWEERVDVRLRHLEQIVAMLATNQTPLTDGILADLGEWNTLASKIIHIRQEATKMAQARLTRTTDPEQRKA